MKKRTVLSVILTAVMLGTLLAGCGSKKEEPAPAQETAAEEKTEEAAGSTEIANPWSDVGSAEDAAKGAGLDSFEIAEEIDLDLGENFERTYRCMEGIAEARLEFAASALTVRKGTAGEDGDISGDYTEYKNTWTQDVNGVEVTCWGNREGEATKSIWSVDGVNYCIIAEGLGGDADFGLSAERLTAMVEAIR